MTEVALARMRSNAGGWGGGGGGSRWGGGLWQNPLTWSVPVGRVWGISVRVSIIYIIWMAIELTRSDVSWMFRGWMLGCLFVIVLLHEFGHCLACWWVGGEADEVLMWMLGGLASCRPPHNWRASLITTAGGPLVNVALLPVAMATMMALGVPLGSLVFNPFGSGVGLAWGESVAVMTRHVPAWAATALFTFHLCNASLLLFNTLLVFYPFDGGRLLQALMWRSMGYGRSMWISTGIGLAGAVVVLLLGLAAGSFVLIGVALMGGITCYQARAQLKAMGIETREEAGAWGPNSGGDEAWKQGPAAKGDLRAVERRRRAAETERAKAAADSAELDRILAKIKDRGMGSLSRSEQSFLRNTTQRSRGA